MFIPSAVCGCLAYWQYERMQWKNDLIRMREGISAADPRDIFSLDDPKDYDKVSVGGRYLHEYSLYVGPRPRSLPGAGITPGYLVVTPMVGQDRKGVVLVNRGWVPAWWREEAQKAAEATLKERAQAEQAKKDKKDAAATAAPAAATTTTTQPPQAPRRWWWPFGGKAPAASGESAPAAPEPAAASKPRVIPEVDVVVGVIQPDEAANQFMPPNSPETDQFHYIQREALARALGLPPDTPLVMTISTDPSTAVAVHKRSPLQESRASLDPLGPGPGSSSLGGSGPDAAAPSGEPTFPQPKNVGDLVKFTTMPQDHLNYALIWATLCGVLALMARTAVTKPLRGPRIVEGAGGGARDAWKASQAS